ncbi:neurexin-3a [Trichonephila clavipes]|nr:neurexin-3a [Trichonephila clavipes]
MPRSKPNDREKDLDINMLFEQARLRMPELRMPSKLDVYIKGSCTASQLDLEGPLFVGALAPSDQGPNVPSEVWTAKLNYGYVGCLRQLVINGKTVDLAAQAREQDSGSLRPSCHTSPSQCDSQPCLNGGLCSEGWNRFVCDCTRTGFTGPVCAKDASTLSFDGSQYLKIDIPEGSKTQAEDVQLRFRTPRPGGLLLATTTDKATTFLVLGLENGKLKIVINLGDKDKVGCGSILVSILARNSMAIWDQSAGALSYKKHLCIFSTSDAIYDEWTPSDEAKCQDSACPFIEHASPAIDHLMRHDLFKIHGLDEALFWLNGYVNKQNCRIWSEANSQVYVETPLHTEKLTVWCALWAGGILLQKR